MSNMVPASWRDSAAELRNRVSNIFDRWLFRRTDDVPNTLNGHLPGYLTSGLGPSVDMEETDDEIIVSAELPGLNDKDFNVELENQRLVLRGEKKAAREEKNRNYYYAESSYGSFYRTIPLPCDVDGERVNATYKHGMLKVRMPKTEEAKARTVHVRVN
jgi:HSP20 family protein